MARLNPLKRQPQPDPDVIYEAIEGYSDPVATIAAGTKLAGAHEAVRAQFGRWMLASLPDNEKNRLRTAAMFGAQPTPRHAMHDAPPVAQPPSGRFRALVARTLSDPDLQHRARLSPGDVVDASDLAYVRYPHYFVQLTEDR